MGGLAALVALLWGTAASASEAALVLPVFSDFQRQLLMAGLVVCVLGAAFGLVILQQLKNTPVHKSMADISHLIYETCKTYLVTQGKFILMLEVLIGGIMAVYFSTYAHDAQGQPLGATKVASACTSRTGRVAAGRVRRLPSGSRASVVGPRTRRLPRRTMMSSSRSMRRSLTRIFSCAPHATRT
jgi:hypothetical protein